VAGGASVMGLLAYLVRCKSRGIASAVCSRLDRLEAAVVLAALHRASTSHASHVV
jgi:hypothetical protein